MQRGQRRQRCRRCCHRSLPLPRANRAAGAGCSARGTRTVSRGARRAPGRRRPPRTSAPAHSAPRPPTYRPARPHVTHTCRQGSADPQPTFAAPAARRLHRLPLQPSPPNLSARRALVGSASAAWRRVLCYVMSCHVMPCHVVSCCVMWHRGVTRTPGRRSASSVASSLHPPRASSSSSARWPRWKSVARYQRAALQARAHGQRRVG
jgi:hypothetical protein